MQENSNARADGIIYEIIDGTPCPPDGGLARAVEYRANIIMHNQRCKDVNEALGWLTAQMRRTIETTYIVPGKGEPRSIAHVADLMRSEEHTSELQSLMRISYAVFCLKKKRKNNQTTTDK